MTPQLAGPAIHRTSFSTPPSSSESVYTLSPCGPIAFDDKYPEVDQCPKDSTRACLQIFNKKEGQEDRVTSVVPIAGGAGELDPDIRWIKKDGKKEPRGRTGFRPPIEKSGACS